MTSPPGPPIRETLLTCPACGAATEARMPEDACQFFFDCPACGALLRPKPGDCCVFCSYATLPCPPRQSGGRCCSGEEPPDAPAGQATGGPRRAASPRP